MIRLATDVGGTFTDLVGYDEESGRVFQAKALTTAPDQSGGVLDTLAAATVQGLAPDRVGFFAHGGTTVINAITERKGARAALVTTAGFRDVLEIGRGNRPDLYNLRFASPETFVPRHLRFEVRERLDAKGGTVTPVALGDLDSIAASCRAEGVEAVAVVFLHSYADPAHEQAAAARLAELLPGTMICASHEISPEWREYERSNTVALNAYVQPIIRRHLSRLGAALREEGLGCPLHAMQSNGGLATFAQAAERPLTLVESGPAGGVAGAARIGEALGLDGRAPPRRGRDDGEVRADPRRAAPARRRLPARAFADQAGLPHPGPGRGHRRDRVGGRLHRRHRPARRSLRRPAERRLPARAGLLRPRRHRRHGDGRARRGRRLRPRNLRRRDGAARPECRPPRPGDNRRATGPRRRGRGPGGPRRGLRQHDQRPEARDRPARPRPARRGPPSQRRRRPGAGLASRARGRGPLHDHPAATGNLLGLGDARRPAAGRLPRDVVRAPGREGAGRGRGGLRRAPGGGRRAFRPGSGGRIDHATAVEARYRGQEHGVPCPVRPGDTLEDLIARFHATHERAYTFRLDGSPIEITGLHLEATLDGPTIRIAPADPAGRGLDTSAKGRRDVWLRGLGWIACPVHDRALMPLCAAMPGPLLVEEATTTTLVLPGQVVELTDTGVLIIREAGGPG